MMNTHHHHLDICSLNSVVDDAASTECLPPEAWDEWLWNSDPVEKITVDAPLNRCHLLGLLWCRYRAVRFAAPQQRQDTACRQLLVIARPIAEASLRELRDTVANLMLVWTKTRYSLHHLSCLCLFLCII